MGLTLTFKNNEMEVTLFRGAANNSWFAVYFNALPTADAENVELQTHAINLRPGEEYATVMIHPFRTYPLVNVLHFRGDKRIGEVEVY